MKQYYYKMNDCKALHATDAECICWHDEGTGPFPGIRIGVHTCHLRDKPEANKMISDTPRTETYVLNPLPQIVSAEWARELERELNKANKRIKQLEDWKESALAVEREWDANTVATMLGGKPGESQRKVIQREVPLLLERIKQLEEAGDKLSDCADQIGWTSCESPQWIKKAENAVKEWRKAKEAKP